ncbi:MAG: helix-turn-helix transcriptional regulator, partial [Eubacteriales bacterium]
MINSLEIAIGEKIKSFRKKREITQEQLANYLNISFQSVSKWECGDAYPDIAMLPKIAMFFGVTTDELLCIDILKKQEEIQKYTTCYHELLSKGHVKEAIAVMRETNAKYPGNYRIMYNLAYAMNMDSFSPEHETEYRQTAHKEIISIGEKILAECKDNVIRTGIIEVMCHVYSIINEREKAKKIIKENLSDIWCSQNHMLNRVLEGEELMKHRQQTLLTLTELYSWEMWDLSVNFAPEDRLTVLENIIKIYSMVFTDGYYGYYHIKVKEFHVYAMGINLDLKNNTKTLEHLKSAADHAIAFD